MIPCKFHGGTGFMKDFPIERIYRDARITSIYEGTSQLQVVAAIRGVTTAYMAEAKSKIMTKWWIKNMQTYQPNYENDEPIRKCLQKKVGKVAGKFQGLTFDFSTARSALGGQMGREISLEWGL